MSLSNRRSVRTLARSDPAIVWKLTKAQPQGGAQDSAGLPVLGVAINPDAQSPGADG
jgi:hypothetical protein